jgi:hypothetical protein
MLKGLASLIPEGGLQIKKLSDGYAIDSFFYGPNFA